MKFKIIFYKEHLLEYQHIIYRIPMIAVQAVTVHVTMIVQVHAAVAVQVHVVIVVMVLVQVVHQMEVGKLNFLRRNIMVNILDKNIIDSISIIQLSLKNTYLLNLNFFESMGCRGTCYGSCDDSCAGDCEYSCAGDCESSCNSY